MDIVGNNSSKAGTRPDWGKGRKRKLELCREEGQVSQPRVGMGLIGKTAQRKHDVSCLGLEGIKFKLC